jgi:hypothetical protein
MKNKKVVDIVNSLSFILENDEDYKRAWIANIAMSYIDSEHWYKKRKKKKYLNKIDKHTIANEAAENFLNILMK